MTKYASIARKRGKMAKQDLAEKRKITPEMAVKILRKNGIEIDEKQVAEVLDLLFILAKLEVENYLKS